MMRALIALGVSMSVVMSGAEGPPGLPRPDFHGEAADPAWLGQLVQFHGHLGPAAVAGARLGMAGLRAVEAKGYFDCEVTCEGPLARPPQSCLLDGVQAATGATLGKRNLHWAPGERLAVRVTNTRTGRTVEVRPTARLMDLLAAFTPQPADKPPPAPADHTRSDAALGAIARKIATLPEAEIVTIHSIEGLRRKAESPKKD